MFVQDRCLDALKALAKLPVSTKILADTQAGKRVRSLSKNANSGIAEAANAVVKSWKDVVRRESCGSAGLSASQRTGSESALPRSGSEPQIQQLSPAAGQAPAERANSGAVPSSQSQGTSQGASLADIPCTGDHRRDKVRSDYATALQTALAEGAEGGDPVRLAVLIEEALMAMFKGATPAYGQKARSLSFNLKDPTNPDLRRKVIEGVISPDVLIKLPPEELASDAKRAQNQSIREKKLFDSAPSSVKQATTDAFQCGKCKKRECTYYQMQTRSADEPMTTVSAKNFIVHGRTCDNVGSRASLRRHALRLFLQFVTCTNCNNKWKFC